MVAPPAVRVYPARHGRDDVFALRIRIQRRRFGLGDPVSIETPVLPGQLPKLAYVVAKEVDGRYAHAPDVGDCLLVDHRRIQISDEQVDRSLQMRIAYRIERTQPRLLAPLLVRRAVRMHQAFRPIDAACFAPGVAALLDAALEITLPVVVGGDRMLATRLHAGKENVHSQLCSARRT